MDIVDPLIHPRWDDLVLATPGSSFFHSSGWARVLHEAYGYRACYLASTEGNRFSLLLPLMEVRSWLTGRRGVSLPFTDLCQLIMPPQEWQSSFEFLKAFGVREQWRYWEVHSSEGVLEQEPCSSRYLGHDLRLSSDLDGIFQKVKESKKRNIRKAMQQGVAITKGASAADLEIFYRLHCMTRKKHGVPPQPIRFFKKVHEHVISRGGGQILLASQGGKTIAAAVFFHFKGRALYKFGASDSAYLDARPNDLLMWEAIQGYGAAGYESFSFGRTDVCDEGLLQFKRGWGGEETPIAYHRYDFQKQAFVEAEETMSGLQRRIGKFLPVPILKFAGSLLYKHIG